MENIILLLIRSSLYLLVFCAGYFLLIRKDARPGINRIFILLSFFFSLALGCLPWFLVSSGPTLEQQVIFLPEFIYQANEGSRQVSLAIAGSFAGNPLLWYVMILTGLVLFLTTIANMLRIIWMGRYNPSEEREGMQVVMLNSPVSPFSFFHLVFIPANLLSGEQFTRVFAHEKAHFQQGHSWDILFMQLMRILFWFHPVWYLFNRELKAQHEFEADSIACRHIQKTEYQLTLLEYTIGGYLIPLSNPFNVSLIKTRLMMMNRITRKPAHTTWLKTLILLPILLLAVMVQSCQENGTLEEPQATEAPAPVPASPPPPPPSAAVLDEGEIYNIVENQPAFPGGDQERINFLMQNLKYPKAAREAGHEGTVFISFVVAKDGSIHNITLLRGVSPELDAEAVRVIELMPDWIPGSHRGEAVNVQFNMPIRFVLPKEGQPQHIITVE